MKNSMSCCVCNLLILTAVQLCSQTVSGAALTFQQRLDMMAKYKRSVAERRVQIDYNSIYSRSSQEISESVYNKLYKDILQDKPKVDILILLDSSAGMGSTGFLTARKFLTKLVSMMPLDRLRDGSIDVAMVTYAIIGDAIKEFEFPWRGSIYREMVRRLVKRASFQNGYENHGTSALFWADAMLENSTRYNDTDTAKVILYATNGHITDADLINPVDGTRRAADYIKSLGHKIFTIVPGTDVDRETISDIASEPSIDYIIPVVNDHSVESIAVNIKNHRRRAHHHNAP